MAGERFLVGWSDIGREFGASCGLAKRWYDSGAPIFLVNKVPVAEAGELWAWLKEEYG